jgi:hypothetical protein
MKQSRRRVRTRRGALLAFLPRIDENIRMTDTTDSARSRSTVPLTQQGTRAPAGELRSLSPCKRDARHARRQYIDLFNEEPLTEMPSSRRYKKEMARSPQ